MFWFSDCLKVPSWVHSIMNTEDMENYNRGLITFLWPALKIWRLLFGNQISVNNSTWYCYSKITAEIFKVKYQAESGVLIQLELYSIHYFKIWLLQFILYWVLYNNKRKCCHDVNCSGERVGVGSVPLRVILPKYSSNPKKKMVCFEITKVFSQLKFVLVLS